MNLVITVDSNKPNLLLQLVGFIIIVFGSFTAISLVSNHRLILYIFGLFMTVILVY